ncbi:MAG: hypothetical protein CBD18_03600 [Opitutales bacterium TMED158]|nr:MAG: hypothetical protein CBD18_03600 [Opitutales bacterium TMED158]
MMLLKTPLLSIGCVLTASLLGALGQFLIAHAAKRWNASVFKLLIDPYFLSGALAYTCVLALFALSFKAGGSVRVVYPLYATTFIWAVAISAATLHHAIGPIQLLGMILLIAGVLCLTA